MPHSVNIPAELGGRIIEAAMLAVRMHLEASVLMDEHAAGGAGEGHADALDALLRDLARISEARTSRPLLPHNPRGRGLFLAVGAE